MSENKPINPLLKVALDIGPLLLFVAVLARFDIYVATATFMVAIVIALLTSFALTRRWPIMPVVTAVLVLIFGHSARSRRRPDPVPTLSFGRP